MHRNSISNTVGSSGLRLAHRRVDGVIGGEDRNHELYLEGNASQIIKHMNEIKHGEKLINYLDESGLGWLSLDSGVITQSCQ